ncbi:DNA processing protein [Mariniphaga anaerophila]|uniref:DNA processing protein n=2 Tax=Mariniphaga anaerophila TaxID=1484053 RepID=A0A1M5DYU4_9BACT|nr:DNA processing protein [Mariniphaga anaerophila]
MVPGIGGVLARNLVAYTGSAENVFSEPDKALIKIPGIGKVNAKRLKNSAVFERAEKELEFIRKYNIDVRFYTDKCYPRRLKACPDAPVILYSKGNVNADEERVVSIVGTRNATDYGKMICEQLISKFAERNYPILIVSGLAYGIDIQAHKMALKYGVPTAGVVGHGLDVIYPSLHAETARKMMGNGGLITDFPSGTKIDPSNFVRRNRVIAGLADATIVVESAEKGGALITAEIASSYNRDVFAFPGRVDETYSRGCNRIIRLNGASLIQDIDDLEFFMGWETQQKVQTVQPSLFVELTADEKKVVELLQREGELFIDQISSELRMPGSKVSALLLNMEFKSLLVVLPGKMYKLK